MKSGLYGDFSLMGLMELDPWNRSAWKSAAGIPTNWLLRPGKQP